MPLHKKITAIVIFAICGFFGGFVSNAFASTLPGADVQIFPNLTLPTGEMQSPEVSSRIPFSISSANGFYACNSAQDSSHFDPTTSDWAVGATGIGNFANTQNGFDYDNWWSCGGSNAGWLVLGGNGGSGPYYYWANYRGPGANQWGGWIPQTFLSAITSVAPSGTISSSSPLTIVIGATINSVDLASSTANGGLLRIFSWVGGVDTAFVSPSHAWTVSAAGATTTSYQVTTDLPAGNFKIYASIYALDSYGAFGPTYAATTTFFTLNTSYFEHLTGTSTPYQLGYKNAPCGISDLSGCFQNAIAFLFYPSVSPGQAVSTISDAAQSKFPFVYVYQLGAIRTSLLTASSTAPTGLTVNLWKLPNSATSTIELISETKVAAVPFSGTIYTVLTWLIWLGMAEYIYYRVIRMHDVNTPPT